jgi:hypothetical protein
VAPYHRVPTGAANVSSMTACIALAWRSRENRSAPGTDAFLVEREGIHPSQRVGERLRRRLCEEHTRLSVGDRFERTSSSERDDGRPHA